MVEYLYKKGGDTMYSKVGKIIKKYTAVIVAIQIALVILAAIVIFIAGFQAEGVSAVLYILVAVLVGVLGSFAVWFTGAFIYAYGEIADYAKAEEISQRGRELMKAALDKYELGRNDI